MQRKLRKNSWKQLRNLPSEGGRTFGSVSTKEISAAVKEQLGLDIDKKKMSLNIPIKSFGTFDVAIKLHAKVTGSLRVKVTEA